MKTSERLIELEKTTWAKWMAVLDADERFTLNPDDDDNRPNFVLYTPLSKKLIFTIRKPDETT